MSILISKNGKTADIIKENIYKTTYYEINSEKEYDAFIELMIECNIPRYKWDSKNKPESYPVYQYIKIKSKKLNKYYDNMDIVDFRFWNRDIRDIVELSEKYYKGEAVIESCNASPGSSKTIHYAKYYELENISVNKITVKEKHIEAQSKINAEIEEYKKELLKELY